ncbi:Nucleoside diphosphate kinase [subsurface metagenome]
MSVCMEKTVVMVKPDGIQRKLVGEIIKRIESERLDIVNIKVAKLTEDQVSEFYKESLKKFPQIKKRIIDYMIEGPSILMIVEGEDAIQKVRNIRGLSDPSKSPVGSIRKDFAGDQNMEELTKKGEATKNIMHASGSKEEVEEELKLFFGEGE